MPPEMKAAAEAAEPAASTRQQDEIEIWPDMQDAVGLFFAMETQWRWVGFGMAGAMRTGLDYGPLPGLAASLEIAVTPRVLADLRVMEGAAVAAWGEKR